MTTAPNALEVQSARAESQMGLGDLEAINAEIAGKANALGAANAEALRLVAEIHSLGVRAGNIARCMRARVAALRPAPAAPAEGQL